MFDKTFDLKTLDGKNGFMMEVNNQGQTNYGIRSASKGGDINGDGIADFVSCGYKGNGDGICYVIFGQMNQFPSPFKTASLDGSNGFSIPGLTGYSEYFGCSVSSGDINGDGYADIVLGTVSFVPTSNPRAAYVIYGRKTFPKSFDLVALDGSNGFIIWGQQKTGQSQNRVTAGDLNDDGKDDIILGSTTTGSGGTAYVIYGQSNFPIVVDLNNFDNGFSILGLDSGDNLGAIVSMLGDINGDAISDLAVSAPGVKNGRGECYIIFGQSNFSRIFSPNDLNGKNGFRVLDVNTGSGYLSSVGDINHDGKADILLGSPNANNAVGASYVIFGKDSGFTTYFDLASLNGENGFTLSGLQINDMLSFATGIAGDVNGDGKSDIILGAPGNGVLAGNGYIIFGRDHFPSHFNLTTLDGANGFRIPGLKSNDHIGYIATSAGDINKDGIDDFIIGGSNSQSTGITYIIFGKNPLQLITHPLVITQNHSVVLDDTHIKAVDLNQNASQNSLIFNISALKGGQFEFINHSASVMSFRQQDILDHQICLTQDGTKNLSYTVSVTNGYAYTQPVQANVTLNWAPPIIVNNAIAIKQNRSTVLTLENMSGDDLNFPANTLNITVSNLKGGHFEQVNQSEISIKTFSQQAIMDQQIQFVQDGSNGAGYDVVVTDGNNLSSVVSKANVTFIAKPMLWRNELFVRQGDSILLSSENINATDDRTPDTDLIITVSEVRHGQFEYNAQPNMAIDRFTQDNITKSAVRFRTDGSYEKPLYNLIVKNEYDLTDGPSSVNVTFHDAPQLVANQLTITQGVTVKFTRDQLSATEKYTAQEELLFIISNIKQGQFQLKNVSTTKFYQRNITDELVQFVHDGSYVKPSYAVTVSDGVLTTGEPRQANVSFVERPLLVNNKISLRQGKSTILTSECLSATDQKYPAASLIFTVSDVRGGQFEFIDEPGISIKDFIQKNIFNQKVQFAQDGSKGGGYKVSVSNDNNLSTRPVKAVVTFMARPELLCNQLFIKQGGSVVLNRMNINVTDDTTPDAGLVIMASNVMYGQFEYNNQPDIAIYHFTQENVTKSVVRFKTNGGYQKPSYDLTVRDDSDLTDGPKSADVTFHDKPRIVNNRLEIRNGKPAIVSGSDLSAEENYTPKEKLVFEVSDVQHGEFQWINASNKNEKVGFGITKFFQKNITDHQVQFAHDDSGIAPSYAVLVNDGELTSGEPQNATITFNDNSKIDNALKIGLGVAGGVVLLTAISAVGFFGYKKYQHDKKIAEEERKLLGKPIAINLSSPEREVIQEHIDSQSSSWGCQLF